VKPVNFSYERPLYLTDALKLLSETAIQTKAMAGGQSLGPLLNMRLVQPDLIVDITSLDELKQAETLEDHLVLGACITHADIEDRRVPDVTRGALPSVAKTIAHRAIRNRGTIGGSLCAADPSADWPTALAALGAEVALRSAEGTRTIPVEAFITGALETALEAGELLQTVRVPVLSQGAVWGFYKVCRKAGQHAHAIGAVLLDRPRNVFRAAIGGAGLKPVVIQDARTLCGGAYDPRGFDENTADAMLSSFGLIDWIDIQTYRIVLGRAMSQASGA
jgi:aerobic carbon-monoxide dehydrogenase medium subunit